MRVPRLVLRRCRRLQVHPSGAGARPCRAQQPQGVRGVVPLRRAEQDPVALPEGGARVQGRAAEEAPAVHGRDRRPVLFHCVRHEGSLLRVTAHEFFFWILMLLALLHLHCTVHNCRYDILVENIMDPAHVPYAHKGLLPAFRGKEDPGRFEHDQEGGDPIKMKIELLDINGYLSTMEGGNIQFKAPCTFHGSSTAKVAADGKTAPWFMLVAFCIPVAPGRSRLIWAFPRNFGVWLYKMIPRWLSHMVTNRVLDSDVYLLHFEERNYAGAGLDNWQKACYVPTSSDSMIVAFRIWFKKYCRNQVGWATPQIDQLPPTPTKDKLLERYWSHVVQCTSCSAALKAMRALEVALQVLSITIVGFLAISKGTFVTTFIQRIAVVSAAVMCFIASRWLANFIEKNFYFQDYVHAYK
ncbi:unnamed protein product [Urochloa decumbens]|uniref:Pheophorbide a oxygenase domain-containing protein n=1 Tax=Urochloa decumbens TaxID=240449 RepID=A0ABC8YIS8_9POAL